MIYTEVEPCITLADHIHCFWELKGEGSDNQWERSFPDGCAGLVMNLGADCLTDNGDATIEHDKTYAVGAMTCYKDSFIAADTHLLGVCLKPGAFANFYSYLAQHEFLNNTVEFERSYAFDVDKVHASPFQYLNHFFLQRNRGKSSPVSAILEKIHAGNGQLSVQELSSRSHITARQLERSFKAHIGMSPKEYSGIVRFQKALNCIRSAGGARSLLDIAYECGYYDHSHLTNEIKKKTGLPASQI